MQASQINSAVGIKHWTRVNGISERLSHAGASVRDEPVTAPVEPLPVLHLLIVDEDDAVRQICAEVAGEMRFSVHSAQGLAAARTMLEHQRFDMILLDLRLSGSGGLTLLEQMRSRHPETQIVVMTAFATVHSAVDVMRVGAADYLAKPFTLNELTSVLERAGQKRHFDLESRRLREKLRTQRGRGTLVGHSPEMEKLFRIVSKVAFATHPVLILGESGSGKEMVARAIHFNGPNALQPFVPVDCASLMPALIEGELFGYAEGALNVSARAKDGLLTSAEGGTVLLEEVSELSLELQAKLLRALQDKAIRPLGAASNVPLRVRILAATSRNLAEMVEQGRFRKDLFFRLNVVNLRIPALRDRGEDVLELAEHFLTRIGRETGVARAFSDDALRVMNSYHWPGNVRELESAVERACALSSGPLLHMGDLPTQLQDFRMHTDSAAAGDAATLGSDGQAIVPIAKLEQEAILSTIRQLKGDKLLAARLLGIGKTTLYRKLKEYGVAIDGELDE